jgi:Aldo/keto reductase family/Cellulase (glycosyl hydrolase family 5)
MASLLAAACITPPLQAPGAGATSSAKRVAAAGGIEPMAELDAKTAALNEETNFEKTGSPLQAYATLTHVNQLFIDTVRGTGGNNPKRLLIVTGYATDITKTCSSDYTLPTDTIAHRLFISVHYYTPWQFVGMTEDASWGKMSPSWGSPSDIEELNRLFDMMGDFCTRHDIPAFIGEFGVTTKKESESRVRWMSGVARAALTRKMVLVLWETGADISRGSPYARNPALLRVLQPELDVMPTLQELGIGFVPFSPLGKGFLTGKMDETTKLDSIDFRNVVPRFTPEARKANQAFVDLLAKGAARKNATVAQVALGWLLAQKPWIVPIPGTTKVERLNENIGAVQLELTPDDLGEIEGGAAKLTVHGARYPEHLQRLVGR